MKLNTKFIKSWWRSYSNKIWTVIGTFSGLYMALPPDAQLQVYAILQPYLPSGGALGVGVSLLGIYLRAKTTKPISER